MRFDIRKLFGTADTYDFSDHSLRRRLRLITPRERRLEARAFIEQFCNESGCSKHYRKHRISQVQCSLKRNNFYEHSAEELAFGARVAWRNHGRCIGRLFWQSLEVMDCRTITEPAAIADHMMSHLREAYNGGRIRSMISVFSPVQDNTLPATIESHQILQYAGYLNECSAVIGDQQNIEITRIAKRMGWRHNLHTTQRINTPKALGQFDRLPILIRDKNDKRFIFPVADDVWNEVSIEHPTISSISDLGLKWYAVPVVSNMILSIGGIDYPCAPFNGFYMCTEIASRDFADAKRYDLLPTVACAMGLNTNSDALWKDAVLTELNRAVLHSFQKASVTLVDHHKASEQYMQFYRSEQSCGRHVAGDWRWIVPPQCSAATDVFHLKMKNYHPVPNFYHSRTSDGFRLMPFRGDEQQTRWQRNWEKISRRFRLWRREPW